MDTPLSRRSLAGLAAGGFALRMQTPAVETTEAEQEANKAVVRRWFDEVINQGNLDVIDEIVAEDYRTHNPDDVTGPGALKQRMADSARDLADLIPDAEIVVEDMLAERDIVATRVALTGTTYGANDIAVLGLSFIQIRDGKMIVSWSLTDEAGFLRQLSG